MEDRNWFEDAWFGIVFDWHGSERDAGVYGRDLTVEHLLREFAKVHPDSVECNAKGHPGYALYPAVPAEKGQTAHALLLWQLNHHS